MTTMTPYAAAKIVNAELKERNLDKVLPPQMIYTYVKKGYITATDVDGKQRVHADDLAVWLDKYIAKLTNVSTESEIDEAQLELDFDGETEDTDESPSE